MSIPTAEYTADTADAAARIDIEIIYAQPDSVWRQTMQLPPSSTIHDALAASFFFEQFPDYPAASLTVGVYGQQCSPDRLLKHADRVELYRPLIFDPMESRRRRAHHRQRKKQQVKMSRV